MDYKKIFLNNLTELLDINGLTWQAFSQAVGIHRCTVYRWFTSRSPKTSSLIKVADYFECSIDYLLGHTDKPSYYPSQERATFLSRYKLLRDQNGLNDYRISLFCQISSGAIANWTQTTYPEFEILVKLREIFDCSFDYLVGRSDLT